MTPAQRIQAVCDDLNLTLEAVFVPFSQSRNAQPRNGVKEPWRSLNWRVTLKRNGRDALTTDYSQGEAWTPAHKAKAAIYARAHYTERAARHMAVSHEIETGRRATWAFGELNKSVGKPLDPPSIVDVVHSLVLDASVLDAGGFDGWADDFGYDPDSRAAESIYLECLESALKLRAAIGEAGIDALREAGEDY